MNTSYIENKNTFKSKKDGLLISAYIIGYRKSITSVGSYYSLVYYILSRRVIFYGKIYLF